MCALIALALGTSPSWAAKICVDAGHGGTDSGATGNGLLEKNCNLSAALKFKAWLDQDTQDAGGGGSWSVVMTRSTDVFISLQGRCDIANNNNADRFMCIHSNAFDGSAHGIETYCSTTGSSTSQDLRNKVYEEAIAMWPLTPRGTKTAAYYVLNHTNMPSELHEMAFIDNAGDAVYLGSDTHLNNHALSELYAIQRHYGITKYRPGSGPTPTPSPTPSPSPTPGNDIIIDNPAAVYTGSWSVGTSSTDKYGADYDYANSGSGATATFNANLPSAGSWQVSVWYPQGSNRANNAPYTVYYDGGSQTFPVNQQAGGGAWNVLGTFTFAGGGGQVVIGTTGANPSVVMADAVRFTLSSATPTPSPTPSPSPSPSPTPSPSPSPSPSPTPTLTPSPSPTPIPADIIIDNPAASFSGTWSTGTSSVDKYGADYRYATAGSGATATYNANVPAAGNYRVSIWYPQGTNRSNNAPYKVNYNGGSQTFNVNQQANGGKWNVLGTFSFAAGGGQVVIMTTGANPTVVMADAVRFTGQ